MEHPTTRQLRFTHLLIAFIILLDFLTSVKTASIASARVKRQSTESAAEDDIEDLGLVSVNVNLPASGRVSGRYLVQLRDTSSRSNDGIRALGLQMNRGTLRGARIVSRARVGQFSSAVIDVNESQLEQIKRSDAVQDVEPIVYVTKQASTCSSQGNAPWNLDRIDQQKYSDLDSKYNFGNSDGEGVLVYVLDTGIDTTHADFDGRAINGTSFCIKCNNINGCPGICGDKDGDGHGTHVAGTIASKTYGVAKKATVVGVKILDDQGVGTSQDVINALRWVLRDVKKREKLGKAVINMSIGGPKSRLENRAVAAIIQNGIPVIVASGNEGIDACQTSPASARGTIAVGSVGKRDRRSSFSNFGKCVNLFAPGERIASLRNFRSGAVAYSGTSMAAPHVTGAVAIYLGRQGSSSGVKVWLGNNGAKGTVLGLKGERNLVLGVPCQSTSTNGDENADTSDSNGSSVTRAAPPTTTAPRTTRRPSRRRLFDLLDSLFGNNRGGGRGNNDGGGRGGGWLFGR